MTTMRATRGILLFLFSAALLLLGAVFESASHALAHSWYPVKCCGGEDCRRVDSIDPLPDGDAVFHAGSISVVVPAEFMRLPSQDDHAHICVYRIGSGEYRPRCVFVPGAV
jgi:hypothetical protein